MIQLSDYGYDPDLYRASVTEPDLIAARVMSVHRERYELICQLGETFGKLKSAIYFGEGSMPYPTTGDFVMIRYNDLGDSTIVETLPRKSIFARADGFTARGVQAVAANFDYVLLVTSLNRDFRPNRLERYLAQAWESGAAPVIVLTKADLCDNPQEYIERAQDIAPGVDVHAVCAHTGSGMDGLAAYVSSGKTLVLLGMSGVGKSSLLNALAGEELMLVNEMRGVDASKGRHTTTHRQLLKLPSGAMIIDTPGMRELGVWDAEDGVSQTFSDIDALMRMCKFSNCTHEREPGCAVRAALRSGELSEKRFDNYRNMQRQARATARLAARKDRARSKQKKVAPTREKGAPEEW